MLLRIMKTFLDQDDAFCLSSADCDFYPGDSLQLSHPSGDFYLDPVPSDEKPIVLLSAGVGITPLLSILRTLDEQDSIQPISWIHGTRNSRVQAFTKDINEIAARRNNVRTAVFMSRPERGDVEGEWIVEHTSFVLSSQVLASQEFISRPGCRTCMEIESFFKES